MCKQTPASVAGGAAARGSKRGAGGGEGAKLTFLGGPLRAKRSATKSPPSGNRGQGNGTTEAALGEAEQLRLPDSPRPEDDGPGRFRLGHRRPLHRRRFAPRYVKCRPAAGAAGERRCRHFQAL